MIQYSKIQEGYGVLQNLNARFIYTIGSRYAKHVCGTHKSVGTMPYSQYENFDNFCKKLPKGTLLVRVQFADKRSVTRNIYAS